MKKSIHNIPKSEGKQLNYKTIAFVVAGLLAVVGFSFMSFKKDKNDENLKTKLTGNNKIEEAENITNRQDEIAEALSSNPILTETINSSKESQELEKLRLQREIELERMKYELEREKLELDKQRREANLVLLSNSSNSKKEVEKPFNPYAGLEIPPIPPYPVEDPNLQEKKNEFSKNSIQDSFILENRLEKAISEYEVKAGTVIPLTLETSINSDLPGGITAVIKTDIYDSKTGNTLLIPAGSRVIGRYSSNVSFGQERVQAVFNRITLPNQESINIGSMNLVDLMGATGVKDKVDTKLDKVFTSVIMSAILGIGAGAVKEDTGEEWKNNALDEGGTQVINVGNSYAEKVLNVQPTLSIRNGYTVGLWVDKDLILKAYNK